MQSKNLERMLQLADSVFYSKNDDQQLQVNEQVIARLNSLHPACLSELRNDDGPYAWILLFPTTSELQDEFVSGKISEQSLFEKTPLDETYDSIYLCSALVLEEFRNQGITTGLTLNAILDIRYAHPIKSLFAWPFTDVGQLVAQNVAKQMNLPISFRSSK